MVVVGMTACEACGGTGTEGRTTGPVLEPTTLCLRVLRCPRLC